MSQADFEKLMAEFDRIDRECDTPAKSKELFQKAGIVDANGEYAAPFREASI
ncbi:MAG TPA: hypothetical protein VF865_18320 [Acidobacteriaceae bacterium]